MNNQKTLIKRKLKNQVLFFSVFAISIFAFVPLFLLLSYILYKGISGFSLELLFGDFPYGSNDPSDIGKGGILPAIVGSFLIIVVALLISAPLGVFIGLSIAHAPNSRFSYYTSIASDILQGTPAIVIGLIAYYWFVYPIQHFSALSASLAFSLLMLPIIISTTSQSIKVIPRPLLEASYALGATHSVTIFSILLPIAFPGILNAIILSISRVLGESAPLLFTSFGSTMIQWDMTQESSAIALTIFQYANSPFLNQQQIAWNASLLLIIIILMLNIVAKFVYKKLKVKL